MSKGNDGHDSSRDWETEAGRVDSVRGQAGGVRACCIFTAERSGQSLHGSGRGGLQEPKRLSGERQATNGCASTKALEECISVQLATFSVFSNLLGLLVSFPRVCLCSGRARRRAAHQHSTREQDELQISPAVPHPPRNLDSKSTTYPSLSVPEPPESRLELQGRSGCRGLVSSCL